MMDEKTLDRSNLRNRKKPKHIRRNGISRKMSTVSPATVISRRSKEGQGTYAGIAFSRAIDSPFAQNYKVTIIN